MCKVYAGYCGTSEIEHGLCACTVDNPLAKARGLSLRTDTQTMLYLTLGILSLLQNLHVLYMYELDNWTNILNDIMTESLFIYLFFFARYIPLFPAYMSDFVLKLHVYFRFYSFSSYRGPMVFLATWLRFVAFLQSVSHAMLIHDHFPVCFSRKINCKIKKTEHTTISFRCFKNFNEESFTSELSNELSAFTLSQSDINEDVDSWYAIINKHLNRHAPIKTRRVKSKRLPDWFTPEIMKARKNRDNSKNKNNWTDYKRYRNMTKNLIRKAKRKHFSESVTNLKDTKAIWQHLRTANKPNISTSSLPTELNIDNEQITDSRDIANKLNEYFTSVSTRLNENNNTTSTSDLTKLINFINNKIPEYIHFKIPPITTQQVSSFIKNLDSTKATDLDGLGPRLLKTIKNIISPSIAAIINKSLTSGKFPNKLKIAKVFPIFKNGSKSDPSNYRPISILTTISKIFEKHVNKHLMGYLNKYNLIHECQSGFRQKHSCQTALVKLIDQWMTCIDNGDIVGTLFIDFRKAFDMVDHALLIHKLSLYKLTSTTLDWFTSYLNCRLQTIVNDQSMSSFSQLQSGVPQGSILGPTLFLLFINDLPLHMNHCSTDLFADDTTFHINGKTISEIEAKLQFDSLEAHAWSKSNKLPINYDKTTSMIIGTKQRLHNNQKLEINLADNPIVNVNKQKLLGIFIDEHLLWTPHIDYLCSTISSRISLKKTACKVCTNKGSKNLLSRLHSTTP